MDTYKIYNYTPERLFKLLSNEHTSPQSIEEKNHFKYFKEYFKDFGELPPLNGKYGKYADWSIY